MITVLAIAEEFGELLVYERIGMHFCNLDIMAVRDRRARKKSEINLEALGAPAPSLHLGSRVSRS
jgi:hypothetical protein